MATLKAREVSSSLKKKGFIQSESDHAYFVLYVNSKKTSIRTKMSHGSAEIDDYLLNMMSLQVKLEKKQFIDLINCPLSAEEYLKLLCTQGYHFP
jgi:predicted RNA binding protein YcfA (HicA-like mRNA interferase family)